MKNILEEFVEREKLSLVYPSLVRKRLTALYLPYKDIGFGIRTYEVEGFGEIGVPQTNQLPVLVRREQFENKWIDVKSFYETIESAKTQSDLITAILARVTIDAALENHKQVT